MSYFCFWVYQLQCHVSHSLHPIPRSIFPSLCSQPWSLCMGLTSCKSLWMMLTFLMRVLIEIMLFYPLLIFLHLAIFSHKNRFHVQIFEIPVNLSAIFFGYQWGVELLVLVEGVWTLKFPGFCPQGAKYEILIIPFIFFNDGIVHTEIKSVLPGKVGLGICLLLKPATAGYTLAQPCQVQKNTRKSKM